MAFFLNRNGEIEERVLNSSLKDYRQRFANYKIASLTTIEKRHMI